ncbi:MAG: PLDc N-terminal domain-containing protein [Defluviitaleaceae bacterium]|nr:PLDc N-terminal domain-containing protein [Defluviitaleaceae bacterium]
MTLFIIGTVALSVLAMVFALFLALWTYEDAKVKSDQSPLLWLLLVLFTSPIGIIVYLLAGRTKKDETAPGKYKLAMIASLVAFILSAGLFTVGIVNFVTDEGITGIASTRIGNFSSSWSTVRGGEWRFRARSANGFERRTLNLDAAQLANLHVLSDSGEGILLRMEQGNAVEVIDISGFFDQSININAFQPGRIRTTLEFNHARDVDVVISWT